MEVMNEALSEGKQAEERNDNKGNQYLSEKFTSDDFASMRNDSMYAFYSVPDTGKTTLIIKTLQPYLKQIGKKALYLSPRRTINDQNVVNFDDTVIHSQTYQKIEYDIINGNDFFKDYDFIICDECHYFVEDSTINNMTDESFNFVNKSDAIVILLSGTPDYIEGIRDQWIRPIVKLADIDCTNHNITKVCLASANKEEEALMKLELDRLVRQKKRVIVYDSNISELHQLSAEYKQLQNELGIKVSFICSDKNKEFGNCCDYDDLEELIDTRHISSDMLFITSALNTGISIDEDFEYLFIFGNPSKTAIFQLMARVRKGDSNRRFKTIYCSVPKYNSIKCRMEGLQLDLRYLNDPLEWQTKRKSRQFPDYMQIRHRVVCDCMGRPIFMPNGFSKTESYQDINRMKLGKLKQDIFEYQSILSFGSMQTAYAEIFYQRYANITVTTLKDELEQEVVSMIMSKGHWEYLGEDEQKTIKELGSRYGLSVSVSKINELLDKYNCGIRINSKQKKSKGIKFQAWFIERY